MTGRCDPHDEAGLKIRAHPPAIRDSLRGASPRRRNRQWEKQQLSRKAVYRGVDPNLALKVKAIAKDMRIAAGEAACRVIEYALRAHERGEFDLHPRPNPKRMRMTLLPRGDSAQSRRRSKRVSKQKRTETLWRVITTWRGFSPELKHELAALASDDGLNVPIGELISALLYVGLNAYEAGLLPPTPAPKSISFSRTHTDT